MPAISLQQLCKRYGPTLALDAISLEIPSGELLAILGPSGCGKTTLLRVIAGLTAPDSGSVKIDGEDVTHSPVHRRGVAMVFQEPALWPHLDVAGNVAFGLVEERLPKNEIARRVAETLAAVGLPDFHKRRIGELSGGQRQRVALARALVLKPRCLLLDEPLSHLDAPLRKELRALIRQLCKERGLTTIHVTHDAAEATAIADRLAIISNGKVLQIGAPAEVLANPSAEVAALVEV